MTPPTVLLRAEHLAYRYPSQRTVTLHDVSLHVAAGELVVLIGPNGSGKSTLLRLLLGHLTPAAGTVTLGEDLSSSLSVRERARRQTMVTQDTAVPFDLRVRDLVALGRYPYRGRFGALNAVDQAAIDRALAATDTELLAERLVPELSGGERQRVHLARALAQETPLLLLDEPTANLDPAHQLDSMEILRRRASQGHGLVAALHDLSLAARYGDRLLLLAQGNLVAAGGPADVLSRENLARYFHVQGALCDHCHTLHLSPVVTPTPRLRPMLPSPSHPEAAATCSLTSDREYP